MIAVSWDQSEDISVLSLEFKAFVQKSPEKISNSWSVLSDLFSIMLCSKWEQEAFSSYNDGDKIKLKYEKLIFSR